MYYQFCDNSIEKENSSDEKKYYSCKSQPSESIKIMSITSEKIKGFV